MFYFAIAIKAEQGAEAAVRVSFPSAYVGVVRRPFPWAPRLS